MMPGEAGGDPLPAVPRSFQGMRMKAGSGFVCGLLAGFVAGSVLADEAENESLEEAIKSLGEGVIIESISPSQLPGIHVMQVSSGEILYVSSDAEFVFSGDLYQVTGAGLRNLTDDRRADRRRKIMADIDPEEMLIYSPDQPARASVVVFTDVDCGYCRKLHQEMVEINALGIEVRYLAFPRGGVASPTYDKMVSTWCADNPTTALTEVKLGKSVEARSCVNPVQAHYELGLSVGVTGTPAMVTESGHMLPGYLPAEQLALRLGL